MLEGLRNRFVLGKVYWATPVHRELPKRAVVMIGRVDNEVQFAFIDGIASSAKCKLLDFECFGREFVKLQDRNNDYNCSSACEIPAADAALLCASIQRQEV